MENKQSLLEIHRGHDHYSSDKWTIYLRVYENIFSLMRNQPVDLLEIGIQNGGSLEVWSKYFVGAKNIVGIDINENCRRLEFEDDRIKVLIGDANLESTKDAVLSISSQFDIIIEDGSHQSQDIVKTFCMYFGNLKTGGHFVIEDLHCSYWREFNGGLFNEKSSIAFFKLLCDILNHEHWGLEKSRQELLSPFFDAYDCSIAEKLLEEIHSIQFTNSICVITKKAKELNELGARLVAGRIETVVAGNLQLNQRKCTALIQPTGAKPISETLRIELDVTKEICRQQQEALMEAKETNRQLAIELGSGKSIIEQMTASTSWRMTAPYRRLRDLSKSFRKKLTAAK